MVDPNSASVPPAGSLLLRWWRMSPDVPAKTVAVVVVVCVFFSVIVSAVAVQLTPRQDQNRVLEKQRNILQAAGIYRPGTDINRAFERVEAVLVDFRTGAFSQDRDPLEWNPQTAPQNPELSSAQLPEDAPDGVLRMPHYATIYLIRSESGEQVESVVLPVYGYGLWSTLWGFLAVRPDMNEIVGLRYYQQQETAGLGGEVDNPKWLALWPGKMIRDGQGDYRLELTSVIDEKNEDYAVEALSGATMTSRGVDNMLRFWLGPNGFGPLMESLRSDLRG